MRISVNSEELVPELAEAAKFVAKARNPHEVWFAPDPLIRRARELRPTVRQKSDEVLAYQSRRVITLPSWT
jgi:hypothetical protein